MMHKEPETADGAKRRANAEKALFLVAPDETEDYN